MKTALCILAACAVAGMAPAAATAADLDDSYDYGREYRGENRYGYSDEGYADERAPVVLRRRPAPYEDAERYDESVDYYDDAPSSPPPRYYARSYPRPYLRTFNGYDRPRFDEPYHDRFYRNTRRASYYDRW